LRRNMDVIRLGLIELRWVVLEGEAGVQPVET